MHERIYIFESLELTRQTTSTVEMWSIYNQQQNRL